MYVSGSTKTAVVQDSLGILELRLYYTHAMLDTGKPFTPHRGSVTHRFVLHIGRPPLGKSTLESRSFALLAQSQQSMDGTRTAKDASSAISFLGISVRRSTDYCVRTITEASGPSSQALLHWAYCTRFADAWPRTARGSYRNSDFLFRGAIRG